MRLLVAILLLLITIIPAWGLSDSIGEILEWNSYYHLYKLSGYPIYNVKLGRYDFFDINNNYCGSLCYNDLTEQWEYLGL
jgi:hypothetical protein